MNKIRQYLSTLELIEGLAIALLGSAFIYLNYASFNTPLLSTLLGLLFFYFLLKKGLKVWVFTGVFTALLWFWWIVLSFKHYQMLWAMPLGLLFLILLYSSIFWGIARLAVLIRHPLLQLAIKSIGLLGVSYLHPFSFDWYKPELVFVSSYIGIEKWQFFIVLLVLSLFIFYKKNILLLLLILSYNPQQVSTYPTPKEIELVTLHTSVQDKWNPAYHDKQFELIFNKIETAITQNKKIIIFPESVFPFYLNHQPVLLEALKTKAQKINIIVGGLYWDGTTPHNSSYIFTKEKLTIASKVLLVPFGESNPLPAFLSDWVNKVFYDGSVDYQASTKITDYKIEGTNYRNAICFEATSEKLYTGNPKTLIVLSNNGWFTPSTEPTLQKLLLMYYVKKYGVTIHHSVNMSQGYSLKLEKVKPF